ncbi:transcriptional regulatory protein OmpR [Escherichia coli]|nr:transcriptional regulatory protein OmpR [Escherichia coli]
MQENYKILVVDDDMHLRALLERYLTEQGFQVRSVANAEQMDRLLTRESFHLMVLDLMLPGEDGLSICRRLRSQSNPMPIIMVTAKGEEVDRIVGLEIGADDYIPKPFNPRETAGPYPCGAASSGERATRRTVTGRGGNCFR